MAQVQIEEIIDHLNSKMRQALEDAVQEVIPNAGFDRFIFDETAFFQAS